MKKTVSILLILLLFVSTMFLSSCGGLGIGKQYTAGFSDPVHFHEYWWLESYDECIDGIESLASCGSSFGQTILLSDDTDLYDMKYCIFTDRRYADKEVGIFVDRFDRKVENVKIMCFAFFEDVEIDELKYSYISDYKAYQIIVDLAYAIKCDFDFDELTMDSLECTVVEKPSFDIAYEYRLKENGTLVLCVEPSHVKNEQISDEALRSIINSIDADMFEHMSSWFVK